MLRLVLLAVASKYISKFLGHNSRDICRVSHLRLYAVKICSFARRASPIAHVMSPILCNGVIVCGSSAPKVLHVMFSTCSCWFFACEPIKVQNALILPPTSVVDLASMAAHASRSSHLTLQRTS